MSNVVNEIDRMVSEMKEEAEGLEVWAFIVTYDENGQLDWKALANEHTPEGGEADVALGSPIINWEG